MKSRPKSASKLEAITSRMCPACCHYHEDDADLESARTLWRGIKAKERNRERDIWEQATKDLSAEFKAAGYPHRAKAIADLVRLVKKRRTGGPDA